MERRGTPRVLERFESEEAWEHVYDEAAHERARESRHKPKVLNPAEEDGVGGVEEW